MRKKLIDIGANLTDPMFCGVYHSSKKHQNDFEHMLSRSREQGVEKLIVTGGSLEDSKSAEELSQKYDNLFTTVGVHPTRCTEFDSYLGGPDAYFDELRKLIKLSPKVVAIGELGLDYDRLQFCPKDKQKVYFEKQLLLAKESKLPLFLHNRNSIDDFIGILSQNKQAFEEAGGVVHSFDGTLTDLDRVLNLGLFVGINGCSLKSQENLDVAKMIPDDKLLIETDCPWCEIRPSHASFKHIKTIFGKTKDASDPTLPVKGRNEPAQLVQILEVLAAIRQQDEQALCEQIYANTNKLFFSR